MITSQELSERVSKKILVGSYSGKKVNIHDIVKILLAELVTEGYLEYVKEEKEGG